MIMLITWPIRGFKQIISQIQSTSFRRPSQSSKLHSATLFIKSPRGIKLCNHSPRMLYLKNNRYKDYTTIINQESQKEI